jgi:hypothetical protein
MADQDEEKTKGKKASDERSLEDLKREIAVVELQTKRLQLERQKRDNELFEEVERRRREGNKRRMSELAEARRTHAATVKICRHKSGGTPKNILKGGGVGSFSIITRTILPDGKTILLQCQRCRMLKYPPEASMKKKSPERYAVELAEYNRLLEESMDLGLEHAEMRGPTFMFTNHDGVPIIPERR